MFTTHRVPSGDQYDIVTPGGTLMSQKEPYVAPEYLTNSFSGYLNARLSPVGLRPRKTNGKMIIVHIPYGPHQQTEKGL